MLPNYQQIPNNLYYQNPYVQQQYQRLAQLEAQAQIQPQYEMSPNVGQTNMLKGRPVVSMEEARAAQIDLDGSLFVFTDIGNSKIYTKQINLDGIAILKTYSLVEDTTSSENYITKTELDKAIASIRDEFSKGLDERTVGVNESINEQQSGTTKKTVCKQSAF